MDMKVKKYENGVVIYFSLREKELFDEITDILYPMVQPEYDSLEDSNIKAHYSFYNGDVDKFFDLMLVKKYPLR